MRCPVCNFKSTRVIDSRLIADGGAVRRRRECEKEKCAFRFSTSEEIELLDIIVVKRNGRREQYNREKIILGVKRALQKRPYTEADLFSLIHHIERDIQKHRGGEITSSGIGDIVAKRLKSFDKVAYIRFASVYKQFDDIETFAKELKKISGEKKEIPEKEEG
ncbi:MAG: transcriptional regulator NrdR [Patescibacteria group bacterium]